MDAPTPAPELPEFVSGIGHTALVTICVLLVVTLILIVMTKRR